MLSSKRLLLLSATFALTTLAWSADAHAKKKDKAADKTAKEAAASQGESGDRADELIREGVDLRKAGNDEKALESFRSAYQVRPTPRARAQMGMAEQALGRWADAEADLKAALRDAKDPWVSKNMKVLNGAVATVEQHLSSLQLLGSPKGAVVKIDDHQVGTLPFDKPVRVTAGEVLVSVSADGYIEINRKITVPVGRLVREVVTLHASPQAPPAAVATAAPQTRRAEDKATNLGAKDSEPAAADTTAGTSSDTASETPANQGETTAQPASGSGRRFGTAQRWGVALAVLGVAAGGVGGVFVAQAISKNNQSSVGCMGDRCNPMGFAARQEALTAGNRATVAFVAAGVLLGGGVTLLVAGRHKKETAWQITPVTDGERMALLGTVQF